MPESIHDDPEKYSNLHESIRSKLESLENSEELDYQTLMPGDLLELKTPNTTYYLAPFQEKEEGQNLKVVFYADDNPTLKKAYITGSTFGGSMMKPGVIVKGMRVELARLDEVDQFIGVRTTGPVESFEVKHDNAEAKRLVEEVDVIE